MRALSLDADASWLSANAGARPTHGGWMATFSRDAAGAEVERRMPGEVVSRWDRDGHGRPHVQRVSARGAQVLSRGYMWRSEQQIAALIDTEQGPTFFEHDARGFLSSARRPDGSVQYRTPDPAGNLFRTPDRTDRSYGKGGSCSARGTCATPTTPMDSSSSG